MNENGTVSLGKVVAVRFCRGVHERLQKSHAKSINGRKCGNQRNQSANKKIKETRIMPRNLHAKRPATQCKAKQKIDNMLCNKLVAQLTTGHGVHVQGLDQTNEDFYGGTLPLHKRKKKVKTFPRCRVEELSFEQMRAYAASQKTTTNV